MLKTPLFITLGLLALATPAAAERSCAEHDKLAAVLAEKYAEHPVAMAISGKASEQNVLEIFVSQKGTWTALKTNKEGMACILGAGEGWKALPPKIEGTGL